MEIEDEYRALAAQRSIQRYLDRRRLPLEMLVRRLDALESIWERITVTGEPPPCRDEGDRKYLHCAVTARVDALVTLDQDLLDMAEIDDIPILTPGRFLALARRNGWETAAPG